MPLNISVKEKLLARCIEMKEESEGNLRAAMEDAQQSANEYGAPKDRYDSFRAQMMRKRDMLAQQLSVADEELRYLRQIKATSVFTKVEAGALVELNTQKLYILVGIGKVEVDNETYYVVSPVVPLVLAMKDMKKGDSFSFRGTAMQIIEIC
jgi:transcription elongation GreA/GreB family factor